MSDPPLRDDVLAYYGRDVEVERLAGGVGALEFERTKELVERFLRPGSTVADIGGATGHYAAWLAEAGHRVKLVEPVPRQLELAAERAGTPPRFGVRRGDARALPFADEAFDAALLLGPLYHLGASPERAQALREAARVVRPGGVLFAAAISRYALVLDVLRRRTIADERVFANVRAETASGRRVAEERRTSPFPDAYFHLPEELEAEVAAAGLHVEGIYGVEGLGWLAPDLDGLWSDEAIRERLLWAARLAERDQRLVAVSAHLLAVARKV